VANLVSQEGIGFDSNENEVVLVTRTSDPLSIRRAPKRAIAARILDETMKLRLALHAK
jgi:phosphopantothenoylcysteine decarboxylase/phosphopantothenate--cysteine ligase